MDFAFEALGDEKFQKFCQALLVELFPNIQCFPIGQPDGGRDGIDRNANGQVIFQVKFSRNPSSKTDREAISSLILSEKDKVNKLIKQGATSYYLLTNVSGTAHLNVGSIDRVDEQLSKSFGIPCYVWWRDDLERRLESSKQLIWRYPELARGQDFLEFLAKERGGEKADSYSRAFAGYMRAQHLKEVNVKFQQVQIQSNLLELFTDTSIGLAREKLPTRQSLNMSESDHQAFDSAIQQHIQGFFAVDEKGLLAAQWLLAKAPRSGVQRIILEGAPGQGKSTVTQYLCQIHRSIGLRKRSDEDRIPREYRNHTLRLPMRVDLRDYALWLTGKDPLASEKNVVRPDGADDSLESLLAYQVNKLSGGRSFDLDALTSVLKNGHGLLVLDGFDEVADTATREKLIEQIRLCTERVSADCLSLQVIVTSRPAAFILSPGFSEREWAHLALLPMSNEQIGEYTDKWMKARGVESRKGRDLKGLLVDRLNRPHIRSLAQNPMQLAILLNLISTKGMSLPDKRTALYDSYMDLFFGREAEKSEVVRENRDVLLQIHQFVAWVLQTDAEIPGGTGSISQNDLKALVSHFLSKKEHKGDVLTLFSGVVERVGALVSRVQGMLEFEVQPLREFFAGRYLYETAPYSPPGSERRGTKPERFAAMAVRPYWLNVLRFYAGCYSTGELLSLVSGLEELSEHTDISVRLHLLQLSMLLLADYVFAQEPRTVRKMVDYATAKDRMNLLLSHRQTLSEGRLALPDKCGNAEIAQKAFAAIRGRPRSDYLARLGLVCRLNASDDDCWAFWSEQNWGGDGSLHLARQLGLFFDAQGSRLEILISRFGNAGLQAMIEAGRWDELTLDQRIEAMSQSSSSLIHLHEDFPELPGRVGKDVALLRIYVMLQPRFYSFPYYTSQDGLPLGDHLSRRGIFRREQSDEDNSRIDEKGLSDVVNACNRALRHTVARWTSSLEPWNDVVESVRRTWGDMLSVYTIAAIAAGIKSKKNRSSGFKNLLDAHLPLAERARFARLQSSASWWRIYLSAASSKGEIFFVLILLLTWGSARILESLASEVEKALDALPDDTWSELFSMFRAVLSATSQSRTPLSGLSEHMMSNLQSERLRLIFLCRASKTLRSQVFARLLQNGVTDAVALDYIERNSAYEAVRDPKLWPNVITYFTTVSATPAEISSNSMFYGSRSYMGFRPYYVVNSERVSPASSRLILSQASSFPLNILELAENGVQLFSKDQEPPLGVMAKDAGWFDLDGM